MLLVPHGHDLRNSLKPVSGERYEALDLVSATIRYLSRPEQARDINQAAAVMAWQDLRGSHNSVLQRLGWANGAKAMASHEMMPILDIFNHLFFFGSLVDIQPRWNSHLDGAYGMCSPQGKGHLIQLSSTYTGETCATEDVSLCEARARVRLGILLHECIHAYLSQYACRTCRRYGVNVRNAGGHGRAFQRLASAIEDVTQSTLGVRISVSDESDFLSSSAWPQVEYLPSRHDMSEWNWLADP